MEALLECTKRLDKEVDEIMPLLISDQWTQANEKVSEMIPVFNEFIQLLVPNLDKVQSIDMEILSEILQKVNYVMQIGDSVQFADVLAYELGNVLQSVYECFEQE